MEEHEVGKVVHFFKKINVAVIKLSSEVKVGDHLHIRGATTDFEQELESMQIDHKEVQAAEAGVSIGIRLKDTAREGDMILKVS